MTLTSKVMPYKKGFGPFAPEVYRAPAPYPYRGIGTDEALASVEQLFKSQVDPPRVAGDDLRARAGRGRLPTRRTEGFVEGLDRDLPRARDRLHRRRGAVRHVPHRLPGRRRALRASSPTCASWGKSIGGGLPLAGVTGRAEIMDASHVGGLGGTFGGNPLSCVAALVALDQVLDPAFQEASRAFGEHAARAPRGHRRPRAARSARCAASARCSRSSSSRTARRRQPAAAARGARRRARARARACC